MVTRMKTIREIDYTSDLGILIDVQNKVNYNKHHNPYSINIEYEKLLLNHNLYLDKSKKYYIICDKGTRSKKAVQILSFYGYDVTYVIN